MSRIVDRTGLNERLKQNNRRSGMMVGVSMALVVGLLIASFTWLFFRLDPFFSDFAGRSGVSYASPVARVIVSPRAGTPTATPGGGAIVAGAIPTAPPPVANTPTPTVLGLAGTARASATPSFRATHVVVDYGQQVNLRAGPSAASARMALIAPGTRLQFLDEQEQAGELIWMRFQTERGDVGWVRQIDVTAAPATLPGLPGTPGPTPTSR
jgi:hypothetical protein